MSRIDDRLLAGLCRRAGTDRWDVAPEAFATALEPSLPEGVDDPADVQRILGNLHLEDLALACGCAAGNERAWDHFVEAFRPVLYRAAGAIDPSGGSRDLADSLYADLFGLAGAEPDRKSLFRYFHGRSSLATWLRAVLAQRHVDRVRSNRRWEPLTGDETLPAASTSTHESGPDDNRLGAIVARALAAAVAGLPPRDRLRLAWYYAHEMTLAEIGRTLDEHEATVSRHLSKSRRLIRERVEHVLAHEHGLSPSEVVEWLRRAAGDAGELDLRDVLGPAADRKNRPADRSITEGLP